jgi:Flp pilus assembly protein TadG
MRRLGPDRGVTIVEAAFALPILFMFFMGLVDLGLWAFNTNQATNAARDGARTAIIGHRQADVPHSDDWDAIVASVEEHLPGRTISPAQIQVRCVDPQGDDVAGGCAAATIEVDRVRVHVAWAWDLLTPIAGSVGLHQATSSGVGTMVIAGGPVPGTPPVATTAATVPTTTTAPASTSTTAASACVVHSITLQPTAPAVNGAGKLQDVVVAVTTNGADRCSGLAVQLAPVGSTRVQSAVCSSCTSITDQTWRYRSDDKVWGGATKGAVRVFNDFVDQYREFDLR